MEAVVDLLVKLSFDALRSVQDSIFRSEERAASTVEGVHLLDNARSTSKEKYPKPHLNDALFDRAYLLWLTPD